MLFVFFLSYCKWSIQASDRATCKRIKSCITRNRKNKDKDKDWDNNGAYS